MDVPDVMGWTELLAAIITPKVSPVHPYVFLCGLSIRSTDRPSVHDCNEQSVRDSSISGVSHKMVRRNKTSGVKGKAKRSSRPVKSRVENQFSHLDNDAMKQLRMYEYPFSRATMTPKIPDGRATLSNGLRFKGSLAYTLGANVNATMDECWVALMPGMTSCACVWSATGNLPDPVTHTGAFALRGVIPNRTYMEYTMTPSLEVTPPPGVSENGHFTLIQDHNLTHWRQVSAAMRIKNLNNSDANEGWWEAVRTTIRSDGNYFSHDINPIANGKLNYTTFHPSEVMSVLNKINWPEDPSYQTGRMIDLAKYEFQLRPTNTDHEFKQLSNRYDVLRRGLSTYLPYALENGNSTVPIELPVNTQGLDNGKFCANHYDDQYDCIVVHVMGHTATQLLVESVSNQEVLASSESSLIRYMSECADSGDNLKRVQRKNRVLGQKPGVVRATT